MNGHTHASELASVLLADDAPVGAAAAFSQVSLLLTLRRSEASISGPRLTSSEGLRARSAMGVAGECRRISDTTLDWLAILASVTTMS